MSEENRKKLKNLITNWPKGAIYSTQWLSEQGVGASLRHRYQDSGWIYAVGHGAVARAGDQVDWRGGLYAVQQQLQLGVHIGAKTALEMHGYAHNLPLGRGAPAYLFGDAQVRLPRWYNAGDWDVTLVYTTASLFSEPLPQTLLDHPVGDFSVKLSCPERAVLELLHLVPKRQGPDEAYDLVEGLVSLRPQVVQKLLEACQSHKVKRCFLFLAEQSSHAWFQELDTAKIELGSGPRSLVKGGVFVQKYEISVPKSWVREGAA